MNSKQLLIVTIALLLCGSKVSAYDFHVDGIYYNITSEEELTVEVKSESYGSYSGDVVIPSNVIYGEMEYRVTSIGSRAFRNCYGLTSITIPESVTSIGEKAFSGCSSLTSISIPEGVTSIGDDAFWGCVKLTEVHIVSLESWLGINYGNRQSHPNSVSGSANLYVNDVLLTEIEIPSTVTSIPDYAFEYCTNLTSIIIHEGVTSIGWNAFTNCINLASITIPTSMTSISAWAFENCSSITSMYFGSVASWLGIKYGNPEALPNYYSTSKVDLYVNNVLLTEAEIPSSVTSIPRKMFNELGNLTSVVIPEGVTSIGEKAFSGCSSLTSISIPEGVTTIGEHAFHNCSSLSTITMPESIAEIGTNAFVGCSSLNSVYISDIESWCKIKFSDGFANPFCGANNLYINNELVTEITIPEGVTELGNYVFYGCNNLTSIRIPESVTEIGSGVFSSCTSLTSIDIPKSVTKIGSRAFAYCTSLISIDISEGITEIEESTFSGCSSLTSVVLPKSLETVGNYAFSRCSKLFNVYCYAENVPSTKYDSFAYLDSKEVILLVPANSLASYKATAPWSDFGSIIALGIYITDIELSQSSVTLIEGETLSLGITLTPEDTDVNLITWSSSNSNVAVVDNKGKVTAVAPGTATIIAKTIDGSELSDSCEVSVDYADYVITYLVDGEVYATDTIARSSAVTPLAEPVKEGYTFSGWSEIPEKMPGQDVTVNGTFTINKYLVNFALDGVVISSNSLEYGTAIVAPEVAEREGYTFGGWQNLPETVPASDITINGNFTINSYTITYVVEEEVYHTDTIAFGSQIITVKYPVKEGYTFDGWSETPEFMPAGDVIITGTFSINSYKITYTVDGETLHADSIEYGDTIVAVAEPVKEGYTFSGWGEIPVTMPAKDVSVNGSFTINKYQITYMVGGDVYRTDSISYGVAIPPVNNPVKEGHTFEGWSELPEKMPARDVTTIGLFSVNSYKITYTVDGETLHADSIEYGDTLVAVAEPVKEGYTFSGWSEIPVTMPARDVAINGSFTINKYQITYMVGEDVYHTDSIAYGTYITSIKNPVREGYTFDGWEDIPEKMPARDVITIGLFSINKYKVTYTADNVTIYTDSIVYGGEIKDINAPTKEGYSFGGWEKGYQTMPAFDIVVNGTFTINKYQISYVVGGETIHTDSITYNERITPIDNPEKEGFNFSGWIGVPGTMPAYDVTVGGEFFIKNMQTDEQGLMYVLNEETETFELSNYEGMLTDTIVIPSDLYGYPVNGIKDRALMGAEELVSVIIPANITSVGYRVFYGCNNISYIEWETTAPVEAKCFDEPARHGNLLVYVKDTTTKVTYQGNVIIDGVAENITISDEQPLRNIREFKAKNISFTREFTKKSKIGVSGGWEAMIIPFDVQSIVSKEKGELKLFGEADFTTSLPYWLGELQADGTFAATQRITANRPFIMQLPNSDEYRDIYNVEGEVTFSATDVTVYPTTDMEQEVGNGYVMLGSYEGTTADSHVYALNDEEYTADGETYMAGSIFVANSRDIRPFEAYVYTTNAGRAPYLRVGNAGETGIGHSTFNVQHSTKIYDLTGRKVLNTENLKGGIYIVNGKKVVIK